MKIAERSRQAERSLQRSQRDRWSEQLDKRFSQYLAGQRGRADWQAGERVSSPISYLIRSFASLEALTLVGEGEAEARARRMHSDAQVVVACVCVRVTRLRARSQKRSLLAASDDDQYVEMTAAATTTTTTLNNYD